MTTLHSASLSTRRPAPMGGYLPALAWVLGGLVLGSALILGSGDRATPAVSSGLRLASLAATPPSDRTTKTIETVAVGDRVLARDEQTGQFASKRVVETYVRKSDHLRIIQIRSSNDVPIQELKTTDEHPFWVPGLGWINAGDLRIDQVLLQDDGTQAIVASTRRESHPEGVTVYNFQVENSHTYFVSGNKASKGVLVHNTCTVIGRMDDLLRFTDDKYDTWWKSGRLPSRDGGGRVTWPENKKWLQDRINRGDTFGIATDPKLFPMEYIPGEPNGWMTKMEYEYLQGLGIPIENLF